MGLKGLPSRYMENFNLGVHNLAVEDALQKHGPAEAVNTGNSFQPVGRLTRLRSLFGSHL